MAGVGVTYVGGTTAQSGNVCSARSPIVWRDFAWLAADEQLNGLYAEKLWENWLGMAPTAAISAGAVNFVTGDRGGWQAWVPTGGDFVGLASDEPTGPSAAGVALGTIRLKAGTTAHNTNILQLGKISGSFGMSATSGSLPKLFFEARVRFNLAGAANTADYFIGLATNGLATGNNTVFTTGDALVTASQNYIGFTSVNSNTINPMYAKGAAQTNVTNGTGAGAIPNTLTNWTKLGFVYDPFFQGGAGPVLRYYQDGALLGYSTLLPASNFPTGVPLTPTIVYQLGGSGTTDIFLDVDWIAVGQYLDVI